MAKKNKGNNLTITIIACAIILVLIIGFGAILSQNKQVADKQADLAAENNELKNKLGNIENKIETTAQDTKETIKQSESKISQLEEKQIDSRILLTWDNLDEYRTSSNACSESFNTETANSTISFQDQSLGIASISLPYNKNWGNYKYKINPYDTVVLDDHTTIQFGDIDQYDSCGWFRAYELRVDSAKTIEETEEELSGYVLTYGPEKKRINGFDVIAFEEEGLCDRQIMIVFGKNYNYRLTHKCSSELSREEQFTKYEEIINTLQLSQ